MTFAACFLVDFIAAQYGYKFNNWLADDDDECAE